MPIVTRRGRPAQVALLLVLVVALATIVLGIGRGGGAVPPPVRALKVAPGTAADLHLPAVATGAPTVVLLHGCCGDRADLGALARALARRGALVLNVDWTTPRDGGGWPRSYREASCAVAVARDLATDHGARADRVVAVGWSDGALLATVAGLQPPPPARGCTSPRADRPDAVVALAPFLGWPDPDGPTDRGAVAWFGGGPRTAPHAWAGGNPVTVAPVAVAAGPVPTVDVVVGAHDPLHGHVRRVADSLRAAGVTVRLHETDRGTEAVATPRTPDGGRAVEVVLARARRR